MEDSFTEGETLSSECSDGMFRMMSDSKIQVLKSFPEIFFQWIFFEQQMKYNELRNKMSVRWHPTINRWCLYLRSKSTKAYDGMHNLLALPSQQTLFDYTIATKVGTGFKDCVPSTSCESKKVENLWSWPYTMCWDNTRRGTNKMILCLTSILESLLGMLTWTMSVVNCWI